MIARIFTGGHGENAQKILYLYKFFDSGVPRPAGAGAGQPRRGRGAGGTDLCKNHRFIKENKVQILGFCCIPGPTCDFEIEGDPTVG